MASLTPSRSTVLSAVREQRRAAVRDLAREGFSFREIGQRVGLSHAQVRNIVREFVASGDLAASDLEAAKAAAEAERKAAREAARAAGEVSPGQGRRGAPPRDALMVATLVAYARRRSVRGLARDMGLSPAGVKYRLARAAALVEAQVNARG
jgi:transposase